MSTSSLRLFVSRRFRNPPPNCSLPFELRNSPVPLDDTAKGERPQNHHSVRGLI
jgi:hypothetical protein